MSDRPLHILTVTSIYPTREEPGLGAFVASQVASLQQRGHHIDVCFLDVRRSKWELIAGIARVRRAVSTGYYDLVHAHFGYNGIPAVLQKRVPTVISYCGTDLHSPNLRPISRWVARRTDACIVKSASLQRLLGHPAHIIPNGVDTTRFCPGDKSEVRRHLGLHPEKAYILFVATDPSRPEKRYDLAQKAVARAGAELLLLHQRPHGDAPLYYQAANALILTSAYEGSPNAVKEAMACNLPIVSTDVGDARAILADAHNCRISPDDPQALSEALRDVLRDGKPSNGREKMAHLSAGHIAAQVIQLYHSVLEKRGAP